MATWNDVRRCALRLPEVTEEVPRDWRVQKKTIVWERPLRQKDLEHLGDSAPKGAILGARVQDVGVKDALVADQPEVFFTTPHFDGYPAVLIRLSQISKQDLEEIITEAWLIRAPKRLAKQYLETLGTTTT